MLNYLKKTRLKYFLKAIKLDVVVSFIRWKIIFINKVAITVEKDLLLLPPLENSQKHIDVKLVEITPASISQEAENQQALVYSNDKRHENRRQKAAYYLKKGYRGFALVRGNEVCGDIWYIGARIDRQGPLHPDMKWLGIRCGVNEAYAFDMYLYPEQRGNNMATWLQNGALHEMRTVGFTKVFGYYWVKNIPALWAHRMLRCKELKRIKLSRFFFIYFHVDKVIDKTSDDFGAKGYGFSFTR